MNQATRLRELRESAELSQYEVAQVARIPRTRISEIECGRVEPREAEVKAFKEAVAAGIRARAEKFNRMLQAASA